MECNDITGLVTALAALLTALAGLVQAWKRPPW